MKPFNLKDALAGKPVMTKNGQKVLELWHFKTTCSPFKLYGVLDSSKDVYCWHEDGTRGGMLDLVMAPNVKTYWANIYDTTSIIRGGVYPTKEHADRMARRHEERIACVSFEVELP